MSIKAVGGKSAGVFYGWWIVTAGVVLCIFGYAGWFYSFGALFNPIATEFGWSRATTSLGRSAASLEGGVEGLITGPLVDRFGPRFMVRVAFTIAALGFLLMSQINSFWMFIVSYSILLSLGMNAGLYLPMQTALAKWFNEKRGLALGILTTGGALGGALVPVVAWLITDYGWRRAVVVLAIAAFVVGWAMSFLIKPHGPEHYGLRMDGKKSELASDAISPAIVHASVEAEGLTLKEAMKTQAFWLLVVIFTLTHTALNAIVVHEIPFIEDMGVSKVLAAMALGTMTLMSSPGRLFGGWLADRWNLKYLYVIASMVQAGGLFIFSRVTSMSLVWCFVIVYGLGYGMRIPLEPAMRAKFFGRKAFGAIMGYLNAFAILGSFAGPYFAGWLFDTTGDYVIAFLTFAVMMVAAGIVVLFVKSPMPQPKTSN